MNDGQVCKLCGSRTDLNAGDSKIRDFKLHSYGRLGLNLLCRVGKRVDLVCLATYNKSGVAINTRKHSQKWISNRLARWAG